MHREHQSALPYLLSGSPVETFCDNITAVRCIRWSQKRTTLVPSSTICADYNVQTQIDKMLANLNPTEDKKYSIAH
eukprot:11136387-Ditylum_brightwellii.AAC.1